MIIPNLCYSSKRCATGRLPYFWSGQALSAIGDEIYRVALIWFAVTLIGPDTGYLAAGQCAALLALSLVGGKWADHWDHHKTMIRVDTLRGLIVLLPVIFLPFLAHPFRCFGSWRLPSRVWAHFSIPRFRPLFLRFHRTWKPCKRRPGLWAGTTLRLARVVGPGIIGLLTPFVSTLHFFTLDAVSFFASALSIIALYRTGKSVNTGHKTVNLRKPERTSYREAVDPGFAPYGAPPGCFS